MTNKLNTTNLPPTKELMLIDNTSLRLRSVNMALYWLSKIEELEKISYKFHTVDMKLYTDWHNLMFSPVIEEINALNKDYQQLVDFHNILAQISFDYNISLIQAFQFWQEEEKKFTSGDQKTRNNIKKIRLKRKKQIEKQINEEMDFDSNADFDNDIDDTKRWLEDENIFKIREDQDSYFNYDFFTRFNSYKTFRQIKLTEDDKIKLKSLYRILVRKIHPDNFYLDISTELKDWLQGIWTKVVQAYKEEDLQKLTILYFKIMIALKEYEGLSFYELNEASRYLRNEYDDLNYEYFDLKYNPAWNFSESKDLKKLKTELAKPFAKQKKLIQKKIEYLRVQHHDLEQLSKIFHQKKTRKSSPTKRKKPRVKKVR